MNIEVIFVTRAVFHALISWLNNDAPLKSEVILITFETFQFVNGWLKVVAPWNMLTILTFVVALPTSQPVMVTLSPVSAWNMLAKLATKEVFQIFPEPE